MPGLPNGSAVHPSIGSVWIQASDFGSMIVWIRKVQVRSSIHSGLVRPLIYQFRRLRVTGLENGSKTETLRIQGSERILPLRDGGSKIACLDPNRTLGGRA